MKQSYKIIVTENKEMLAEILRRIIMQINDFRLRNILGIFNRIELYFPFYMHSKETNYGSDVSVSMIMWKMVFVNKIYTNKNHIQPVFVHHRVPKNVVTIENILIHMLDYSIPLR